MAVKVSGGIPQDSYGATYPGGEYPSGTVRSRGVKTSGKQIRPDIGGQTEEPTVMEQKVTKTPEGTDLFDESMMDKAKELASNKRAKAALDATSGVIKAVGGVINANSKYSSVVSENNFNIQQAQAQARMVASDAQRKMLREQTKGKARGQEAMIAAVAQGQAASGDIAQTAISNEEVYAAENMMALEINAMRQVFGLETTQRQLESSSRMAEINRDLEVSQAIVGGVMDLGSAGIGLM